MKKVTFTAGQVWQGESFVDVVNQIFHKNYKNYFRCTVDLNRYGKDAIAWIVFFDGKPRGTGEKYVWENRIINEEQIVEEYVGQKYGLSAFDKHNINKPLTNITERSRLIFQRDPDGRGNKYKVKFLGYYQLEAYDEEEVKRLYQKKADTVELYLN